MDKDTIFTHAREYLHIYVETGEMKPASKALKRAYQELTGSNPMYLKGKNSRGEKTYANTREYKTVKQIYLPRLERLVRAMLMERASGVSRFRSGTWC